MGTYSERKRQLNYNCIKEECCTMPLTEKGKKIKKEMKEEYGNKKGEQVFYASQNKETIRELKRRKNNL
jgi:hypothetical protein